MECRTIGDQPKRNRCYENVHRRFPFGKSRDESMNSPQEENDNPIPRWEQLSVVPFLATPLKGRFVVFSHFVGFNLISTSPFL